MAGSQGLSIDSMVPRHHIYLEAFGASGDRVSVNYEYRFWRGNKMTFLARTGVFYFRQDEFSSFKVQRDAGDMIFGIQTIYAAPKRHRVESGIGINVRWQSIEGVTNYLSNHLVSANLGYRMLPAKGHGLSLRATMMLIYNADYNWLEYYVEGHQNKSALLPWAGVSVGYSF